MAAKKNSSSLSPPTGGKIGSGGRRKKSSGGGSRKPARRRKSSGGRSKLAQRFANFKGGALAKQAIPAAEILGASALGSALAGYFGDRIKLWGTVDARAALAVAAGGYALYGKPKMAQDLTNVAIGLMASWINDKTEELGMKYAPVQQLPVAELPAAATAAGMAYVGNIDEVGLFKKNPEKIESRLKKKLDRIKRKSEKKGIDWDDVRRTEDRDDAPVPVAVAPAAPGYGSGYGVRPAAPWFRRAPGPRRRFAANHPRIARRIAR